MTRLTTSGDGNGYGYGYGYGDCYGDGYGDGYGYGLGGGYGSGDGYGLGYGIGDGDGLGGGDGSGTGIGEYIGKVGYHAAEVLPIWGLVRVGCMVHTLEWWEQNWQQAAEDEDDIDIGIAEAMLAKARAIIGSNCKS